MESIFPFLFGFGIGLALMSIIKGVKYVAKKYGSASGNGGESGTGSDEKDTTDKPSDQFQK